jgi:excisionase family DNA binding protein
MGLTSQARKTSIDQYMSDRLYTTNQLAKLFGVVPTTVIDWIERGKLEAFKTLGGHRRITHQAVLEFLRRNRLPYPPAFAAHAPKILLLDDEPGALALFQDLLQRDFPEAQVIAERHPVEALVRVGAERPQLVVFDIHMPDMNGFEFCRRLREHYGPSAIRLLAVSGDTSEDTVQRIRQAGADQFLAKTAAGTELGTRCRAMLLPREATA